MSFLLDVDEDAPVVSCGSRDREVRMVSLPRWVDGKNLFFNWRVAKIESCRH
jgi:hypothetical protein